MYIPPGFNTVAPYFIVEGAESFITFLKEALGGTETMRTVDDEGVIRNCIVRIGDSSVMVTEAAGKLTPMSMAFYLYVEDADASMQRALDNGATLFMEVDDQPYGDRQGGVRDPHGNYWWISQRIVEAPYEA